MTTAYPADPASTTTTDPADFPETGHLHNAQPLERASDYLKAVASIIGATLVALVAALANTQVSTVERLDVCVAFVGAVVAAAVQALAVAVLGDGIDLSAWLQVAIAVLTAAGVVILPHTDPWAEWVQDNQLGT
ncbi:hypothetical protein [Pseudokineococcus sp. 1T1Z-3]|uniref:hypothetical protein n=1 Tax=Pseudokineococcus sp. 1T1Z-3 TaxID=3132745 RepID=UPI0030B476CA